MVKRVRRKTGGDIDGVEGTPVVNVNQEEPGFFGKIKEYFTRKSEDTTGAGRRKTRKHKRKHRKTQRKH